ncbi:phosphopantetheine adenylyltransferase [Candidatus Bathyarchaeota archaeon]|jgi:pantetheine-phosphate adenylyltransferase|nr:phosphopantetheine adenylyltransferase [Candidatus Bathyarchaeota archaeon]MDP6048971.1 phosphopantetheine adenylyltransferase [Candidatus Bathyarchaeota archaeon]MDP7443238.1 phosphopantetheine adenylyltransferase [Candidatus Bathyarchaeota archaeon]|tara:strand:+ start:1164 stop:1637 length:474 start_codon:yes stop_codon:yes gene_type:complete
MDKRLNLVVVGGTFDVFHKGHSMLLEEAFKIGDRVVIGLTTDDFAANLHKAHKLDCYAKRKKHLIRFLSERGLEKRTEIFPLDNPFGPTIESEEMEGIVVSKETEAGALEINRRRVERGRKPLLIVVFKMILAQDGKPISSTRIRQQEVNRFGKLIG